MTSSTTSTTNTHTTPEQVLRYIPNLIGYGRVIATLSSFFLMIVVVPTTTTSQSSSLYENNYYWLIAIILYLSSFVGDLFDGLVARKLHQTSNFGGLLDMVTDRCSTLGLLFVLSGEYTNYDSTIGFPIFRLTFLALVLLDISSHWCQMYSTCSLRQHHKSDEGNEGRHFLVRWFYQYYYFFGYLCVGAEFSYILAYILLYLKQNSFYYTLALYSLYLTLPGCVLKQAVNVMQLSSACYAVAQHDAETKNKNK